MSTEPKEVQLWYLASPYLGNEEENFGRILFIAAHLLEHEKLWVFSPILHSHEMAIEYEPLTYEKWLELDKVILDRCDGLLIAAIEGFKKSRGIKAELRWAVDSKKPVKFVFWDEKAEIVSELDRIEIREDQKLIDELLAPVSEEQIGKTEDEGEEEDE